MIRIKFTTSDGYKKLAQWLKQHKKLKRLLKNSLYLLLLLLLLNLFAGLYPNDTFLAGTTIDGYSVGGLTVDEALEVLEEDIERNTDKRFSIVIEGDEYLTTQKELGISIEKQKSLIQALTNQQNTFFPLIEPIQELFATRSIYYTADSMKLKQLINTDLLKYHSAAINPSIRIEGEDISITPGVDGIGIDQQKFSLAIAGSLQEGQERLEYSLDSLQPKRNPKHLQPYVERVKSIMNSTIQIKHDDIVYQPTKEQIISWILIADVDESFAVRIDKAAVVDYISNIAKGLNIDAINSITIIENGRVIKTTSGQDGLAVDTLKPAQSIINLLSQGETDIVIEIEFISIKSYNVVQKAYTLSSAGLKELVEDWTNDWSGDFGVFVSEIGGSGSSATYNTDLQFVSASTYKLYLAYMALFEVEQGSYSLQTKTNIGITIEAAIKDMITYSGNDSAISLGQLLGWANVDAFIKNAGYSSTTLNNYNAQGKLVGDKQTSARDLQRLLRLLKTDALLNNKHTKLLLDAMSIQIYRDGLWSGFSSPIASKVGFLEGNLHEAGIVSTDERTFVVVVLSKDSSWTAIADLASRLDKVFVR